MILIDTSAWIEFFRRNGDPKVKIRVKDLLAMKQAAYSCPIRFELVQGARPEELKDVCFGLDLAQRFVLSPQHWDWAGFQAIELRRQGIQIPLSDRLIASVAVREELQLLTHDRHFRLLQESTVPDLILD